MVENEPASPSPKRAKTAPKKPGVARRGVASGGLALILALISLIGSAYLWYALLYSRHELLATDVIGTLTRLDAQDKELRESLAPLEEDFVQVRETQVTIRASLDKLQNEMVRNRTEWMLSEAEQLLVIANHRLQLARDVSSAISALRAADRQLTLVPSPELLPIRREIAREINQLEAIEKTDIAGIALKLANLADSVDRLPLVIQAKGAPAAPVSTIVADAKPGSWRESARGLWNDLLGLVRIRYDVENRAPLLAPEQQYFLRENVRLLFYGAQHAILQGNVTIYRRNLDTARRWIKDYFDTQTQAVINLQAELETLSGVKLAADLPVISASLDMLRRLPGRKPAP
jgi:uncharacterized protein HemX